MAFNNFDPDEGGHWGRTVRRMMDEMLQRHFVDFRQSSHWRPAVNLYEGRTGYLVGVELAGMQPEEIDVRCITPTRVSITGRRSHPRRACKSSEPLSMHMLEIEEGAFHRELDLPTAVDTAAVSASYEDGLLWIALPKAGGPR